MLTTFCSFSQNEYITLGKRKNIMWGRKIDSINLANKNTYYYPIYFKANDSKFSKAGIYGGHLYQHLNYSINSVNTNFYKFRRCKIWSHVLLGSSITFLSIWTYRGALYYATTGDNNLYNMYLKNGQFLVLLGYAFSITSSIHLNIRGDKKLINSVKAHNQGLKHRL